MLALPLLLQAAAPVLAPLDRQALPARGCAVYLWAVGNGAFTAVAGADPARLRVNIGGNIVDLPRVAQSGPASFGLATSSTYEGGGWSAVLTLTVATRDDLAQGAMVPQATLTLRRSGADELIQPLGGLIGCAATPAP